MLAERVSAFGGQAALAACSPGRSAAAPARLRETVCCLELRSVPYWQCPWWQPGNLGIPKNHDPHDVETTIAVRLRCVYGVGAEGDGAMDSELTWFDVI